MPVEDAARRAAAAIDDLASALNKIRAERGTGGAAAGLTAEALADAIRRGQSPELVAAMKRALGLQ